jgi:hypothetical protein
MLNSGSKSLHRRSGSLAYNTFYISILESISSLRTGISFTQGNSPNMK